MAFADHHARPDAPALSDADHRAADTFGHPLEVRLDLVKYTHDSVSFYE
jgi:hypothetical protein